MRVLIVTETGSAWPSGFVRALIYKKLFQEIGWEAEYRTRRSERLTRLIDTSNPAASKLLRYGLGRFVVSINRALADFRDSAIASSASRFDAVYLQKIDSFPLVRRLAEQRESRLVFDLNDGLWLPQWSGFLSGKLTETLRSVDAVTCDNPFGLDFAKRHAKRSYLVPDPAQVEAFDARREAIATSESQFTIGWVGSRNTSANLFVAYEALEEAFSRNSNLHLRILGSEAANPALPKWEKVRASYVPRYDHARMVDEVLGMHVGLFPLFNTEDSRARGVLKATVYMGGGACVMASPVGQCRDLIRSGENGFLCETKQEWIDALDELASNQGLRKSIGQNALAEIRRDLSLRQCFDRLCASLRGDSD